jgi:hypothetical protein
MIRDPKLRGQIKTLLLFLNILFTLVLLGLLSFEAFVLRPAQISVAMNLKQYVILDINGLQREEDKIKPDYIGHSTLDKIKEKHNQKLTDISQGKEPSFPLSNEEGTPIVIQPKISLIVANLGLNKRATELAITLPKQISLGFLPFTTSLKPLMFEAFEKGHELYLHIPFERKDSSEFTGRYALSSRYNEEENLNRLLAILTTQKNYIGIYVNNSHLFEKDGSLSGALLKVLKERDMTIVLESKNKHALNQTDYIIAVDIFIDNEVDKEVIRKNLDKLIEEAKQNKKAVGYSQGYVLTINMIKEWIPLLKDEGIELVPISALK